MRMELHILGTSSSRPAHGREVSGSVVICDGKAVLVDCGEGLQSRLQYHSSQLKANNWQHRIAHTRIDVMLFTHGHLDHTWGALPMLQSMALDDRRRELTIAAPIHQDAYSALLKDGYDAQMPDTVAGVDMIEQMRMWWKLWIEKIEQPIFSINWYVVSWPEGAESWLKLKPDERRVEKLADRPQMFEGILISPHRTTHSVPSCAWRIGEADRLGKFDGQKAGDLGLSNQEIAKLAGGQDLEKDGQILLPEQFRGPHRVGLSLLISGDTGAEAPGLEALSADKPLDLMVHEATYVDEQEHKAREYLHSTARDAANAAKAADASHLVLTHYSSRLSESETSLEQARQVHRSVCNADDGDIFVIGKAGEVQLFRHENGIINEISTPFAN
jgi:ribonuclease Z